MESGRNQGSGVEEFERLEIEAWGNPIPGGSALNPALQKGEGWRLGWDPTRGAFPALVGAEDWALELTDGEFRDFCDLTQRLAGTLTEMAQDLMTEERISCEIESDRIWLEAEGFPHHYELRVMVLTGRRGEGLWAPIAIPALLQALQTLAAQLP